MMQYKDYTGKVEFDNEADTFHGEAIGPRNSDLPCYYRGITVISFE